MAVTLGNLPDHASTSNFLVNAAQNALNAYINNQTSLETLQFMLGSESLMQAAGVDTTNSDDVTLINNLITALLQLKATFEGTSGVSGAINIVQLCANIKGF